MKTRLLPAFTLMEVLVVISVITLLMAVLVPVIGRSREAARRTVCMSNLKSIGQVLHTYSLNHNELLVPGDGQFPWEAGSSIKRVNLGYLLPPNKELAVPSSDEHVFFCPSMRTNENDHGYKIFSKGWNCSSIPISEMFNSAPISYMFNSALDGFDETVESSENCTLSHRDRANFLFGDGSVNFINLRRMIFDPGFGLETIPEVCKRYNVTFPTVMLFNWFERGEVDVNQAWLFLENPTYWVQQNATVNSFNQTKPILLAKVAKKSLVADVVGGWAHRKPG